MKREELIAALHGLAEEARANQADPDMLDVARILEWLATEGIPECDLDDLADHLDDYRWDKAWEDQIGWMEPG